MTTPAAILSFEGVALGGPPPEWAPVSFGLGPGAALVIEAPSDQAMQLMADAAGGVLAPQAGVVRFDGTDWRARSARAAAKARGGIGRVFARAAWLSNLDVDENILLAQRHLSTRAEADLLKAARGCAQATGLADLPAGRPAWATRRDLQRAQWVRALYAAPRLLVLEDPTAGVTDEDRGRFAALLAAARADGAAVLWLTAPGAAPASAELPAAQRLRAAAAGWHTVTEDKI